MMYGRSAVVLKTLSLVLVTMLAITSTDLTAKSAKRAQSAVLKNGMQIVVIEDRRAPVVTHMVWYKVGAADEPAGKSGIAHFLEHLMFKSTEKIATGEFSKIVSRMGGRDNAFTSQDVTAYFQNIARDRLPIVMQMEADRMINLRLTDKEVTTERDVILEERRSRIENNPSSILSEQMNAALYLAHPYGSPVIGWHHEIQKLNRKDALSFYKEYYAPNNAILVVAGDVALQDVKKLAEVTFGKIPANPNIKERQRPKEPPHRAARRVELIDPRVGRPTLYREYLTPSYVSAKPGEAEALDLLLKVLAGGATSRLYRRLVVKDKIASNAGGYYGGSGIEFSSMTYYAVPAQGVSLDQVEAKLDVVLADIKKNGITEKELKRAKKLFLADYIYDSDSQSKLARRYGWALTLGKTVKDIETWPDRISAVSLADIKAVAGKYIDIRRSVTGRMLPKTVAPSKPSGKTTGSSKS